MRDDDATRARRYRRHRQGDHTLCRHAVVPAPVPDVTPGEIDARAELEALAARLAAAHRADPGNPGLARELRTTLLSLGPSVPEVDLLDQLFSTPAGPADGS